MRIVAGKYKGRPFPGKLPPGIRPTTDRTREAIFNILMNYVEFDSSIVADVCAGSGALGFEALSRGAERCAFIEKSRKTAGFIHSMAKILKVPSDNYKVHVGDAIKILNKDTLSEKKYDLIFIDPPYILNLNPGIIEALSLNKLIEEEGIIVSESSSANSYPLPEGFEIINERIFGSTKVVFYLKI